MFLSNFYKLLVSELSTTYTYASIPPYSPVVVGYDGNTLTDNSLVRYENNAIQSFKFFANPGISSINYIISSGSPIAISNNSTVFYNGYSNTTSAAYWGTIIGDGDAAPTINDYALSGNIITDFTATSTMTFGANGCTAAYTITNTGASDIVIREIGLSKKAANSNARILLTHDVFESPVTIGPGNTGVLNYKIEIS